MTATRFARRFSELWLLAKLPGIEPSLSLARALYHVVPLAFAVRFRLRNGPLPDGRGTDVEKRADKDLLLRRDIV